MIAFFIAEELNCPGLVRLCSYRADGEEHEATSGRLGGSSEQGRDPEVARQEWPVAGTPLHAADVSILRHSGSRFSSGRTRRATPSILSLVDASPMRSILDLRCDGKAYGGCQAACLIFWKEAWLKPVKEKTNSVEFSPRTRRADASANEIGCTEDDVWHATCVRDRQAR